jgi:hypothetical protein
VIETAKRILVMGLLGAAVALLTAAPAAAKSCGQKVVDDWWAHGTVTGNYPIDCYRDALKLLPDDASTYSSAPDEIRRALAVAVQKHRQPPPPPPPAAENPPPPPPAVGNQPPPPPAPAGGTSNGSGSGTGGGKHTSGPSTSTQNEETTTEASGGGPIAIDPGGGSGGGSGSSGGGSSGGGSAQGVLDKIGPDSADGLPLPLLIVAGLALLLLAAGSAGLIARRLQARKVRTPAVPPRQPRG